MKIERDKDNPGTWKLDVRKRDFKMQKDAENFVSELRVEAKKGKYGLGARSPAVTVQQLADESHTTPGIH
jgi:hypothetical protein